MFNVQHSLMYVKEIDTCKECLHKIIFIKWYCTPGTERQTHFLLAPVEGLILTLK